MTQDIFNAYAQIALEKGLISKDMTKTAQKKVAEEDLSTVEMLYGKIKPFELLQEAHPNPCIISPSYDRVNGLVENLQEQHDIMCGILFKPPQAKYTQHRYASSKAQLVDELIKIGFMMENQKQEQLRVFADSCAEQMVKEAIPFLIPGLIAAGVITAWQGLSANITFPQGLLQDADRSYTELQDAVSDDPQLSADVAPIMSHIANIKSLAMSALDINAKLVGANSKSAPKNVLEFLKTHQDKELINQLENYKAKCIELMEEIPTIVGVLKQRLSQYSSPLNPKLDLLRRVYRFVVPSNMETAWKALENLLTSLSDQPSLADTNVSLIKSIREKTTDVVKSHKENKISTIPSV